MTDEAQSAEQPFPLATSLALTAPCQGTVTPGPPLAGETAAFKALAGDPGPAGREGRQGAPRRRPSAQPPAFAASGRAPSDPGCGDPDRRWTPEADASAGALRSGGSGERGSAELAA